MNKQNKLYAISLFFFWNKVSNCTWGHSEGTANQNMEISSENMVIRGNSSFFSLSLSLFKEGTPDCTGNEKKKEKKENCSSTLDPLNTNVYKVYRVTLKANHFTKAKAQAHIVFTV